jgi:hypothetical protein
VQGDGMGYFDGFTGGFELLVVQSNNADMESLQ